MVSLWILAACHSSPDHLYKLAALLKAGVALPRHEALARELVLVAAAQGSVLANLDLASHEARSCATKFGELRE